MEFIETMLIACIPAAVTGIISFIVAKGQAKSEIKRLEISNRHDIDRLMEQHKIDIGSLKEEHALEMESKEKDHQHKLEIIQIEHENEIMRREKEQENAAKYGAMGSIMNGLFGGVMSSPDVQKEISDKITSALRNGGDIKE